MTRRATERTFWEFRPTGNVKPWFLCSDSALVGREIETMDNIDLSGQVAIVTGAGRGLGRAFARALAEAGGDCSRNRAL